MFFFYRFEMTYDLNVLFASELSRTLVYLYLYKYYLLLRFFCLCFTHSFPCGCSYALIPTRSLTCVTYVLPVRILP